MTTIDEKEILELEKFKAEIRNFNNSIEDRNRHYFISTMKLAFYGVAVGAGGTFAIAKTISLMGW
ncbi:hypothetical protein JHD49_03800 [Sulfurimonas sp. SAG-AH-194-C21]|nr:hypothetical protein [Sulfurimonas sp. SAG-AH-194-C21]MDF1883055.1 hypothetical protein [Sulfurimonas sp. SAG-AH-194-C21]